MRPRRGEIRARRLLVRRRCAVLEVDDDLVHLERSRLLEHAQARGGDGEAGAAGPRRHRPNLTVSLQTGHGSLTPALYGRGMRIIVALTGALTVLFLVLPLHT